MVLTGFKPDREMKLLYTSVALGLGATILPRCSTVDEFLPQLVKNTEPNTNFLVIVKYPSMLIKLLDKLSPLE